MEIEKRMAVGTFGVYVALLASACSEGSEGIAASNDSDLTTVDPTFGVNGRVVTTLGGDSIANETAAAAVQLVNGQLLVGAEVTYHSDFGRASVRPPALIYLRYNADGALDTTYSREPGMIGNGWFPHFTGDRGSIATMLRTNTGRILSIGSEGPRYLVSHGCTGDCDPSSFHVVAFQSDGNVDPTFGGDRMPGHLRIDFGRDMGITTFKHTIDYGVGAVLQSGGQVVIGGTSEFGFDGKGLPTFALARLTSAGILDATFVSPGNGDDAGRIRLPLIGPTGAQANAVAGGDGDAILMAGNTAPAANSDQTMAVLARVSAGGALDPAFGKGGLIVTDLGVSRATATSLLQQSDGTILVGGGAGDDAFVARFDAKGALDPSFGVAGVVRFKPNGASPAVVTKLVAAGPTVYAIGWAGMSRAFVLRIHGQGVGAFDVAFGNGGILSDFGSPIVGLRDLLPIAAGKLLAVGRLYSKSPPTQSADSMSSSPGFSPERSMIDEVSATK